MKKYKELLSELPSKTVVVAFGQFNPPSVGHELLIKVVRKLAKQRKADHTIFVSSVQDKKNPLEISKKIQYLDNLFPGTRFAQKEIPEALNTIKRYKKVVLVAPSEMVDDWKKIFKKNKLEVEIVTAGTKCPDSDDKLVKLATKGEYQSFKSALPTTARELDAKRLMNDIRIGLDIEPIKEQLNLVKDELREQYFRGEIFNEGDIVESNDTVYRIVKRGSNHLLLQNEQGLKVSKWIQEVQLTEREFMLDNKLQEADATQVNAGGSQNTAIKKAESDSQKAMLTAKQAEEKAKMIQQQKKEMDNLKTSLQKEDKYAIPKSLMSLNDFRKTMKMGADGVNVDSKETESDIDAEVDAAGKDNPHTNVGGQQMDGGKSETIRRMRVKYHLGEAYGRKDAYTRDYEHSTAGMGKHQSAAYHADGGANDEGWGNSHKSSYKPRSVMDRPHTVHIGGKPWKKFSNGHQAHAAARTLQSKGKDAVAVAHYNEETEIDEARMSAAVKLQRAFERQQAKSAASRQRAQELLNPKKEEPKAPVKEETEEQQDTRKAQLKRFKDQCADSKLTEAQYAGLEKEDKPGKKATEFKGTKNAVTGKTVEGWKDEQKPVAEGIKSAYHNYMAKRAGAKADHAYDMGDEEGFKKHVDDAEKHRVAAGGKPTKINTDPDKKSLTYREELEFPEINEEEFTSQVQADLDALTEEDFYEAYEDSELAIIDEDTGEEIEAVAEEAQFDAPALMEVLSRIERIKAKARMRRSQAKRERKEKVALRQLSTPQVANKRARRMAISAMKKRLLRGQNPAHISVGQKERVERFIAQRKKIVDRLSARMVSRVKQVEKARMSHKKFTKPNNGVTF